MNLIAPVHLVRSCEPMIDPHTVVVVALRIRHRLGEVHRIHDGVVLQIARVSCEEIRCVFPERPAHIAPKEQLIVRRLRWCVWVVRVERTVRPANIEHTVKLVAASTRFNFYATEAGAVVDRGIGITVDVNCTNGGLRWNLSIAETIDIKLWRGGASPSACHRDKLLTQRLRIVGKNLKLIGSKTQRTLFARATGPWVDADYLCSDVDGEAEVEIPMIACVQSRFAAKLAKACCTHRHGVRSGRQSYSETSSAVRRGVVV